MKICPKYKVKNLVRKLFGRNIVSSNRSLVVDVHDGHAHLEEGRLGARDQEVELAYGMLGQRPLEGKF
jgi:hypothetical protein